MPTEPGKLNAQKKSANSYSRNMLVGLLCMLVLTGLVFSGDHSPAAAQRSSRVTFDFKRYTQNRPFRLNTLPTTMYGPPWADIVSNPKTNMLECQGNTAAIALCYYSGPGPSAPCVLDGLGIANCTCYEIPAGQTYLVDINAILSLDVYLKTVAVCGKDGSNCLPTGKRQAPVCDSINRNTLIPGADLISTFSLYLEERKRKYPQFAINPTSCPNAAYAGCMTAPCKRTGETDRETGLQLVQCGCPVYTGPYQVGVDINTNRCELEGNYVWSAAYTPPPGPRR
jgi:hypothetical protein